MLVVALASPPLGAVADQARVRKRLLTVFSALSVTATASMATVTPQDGQDEPPQHVPSIVGFEAALVYYNAYLPDLASLGWRGQLSAYGFAAHYLGAAGALLAAVPFAARARYGGAFRTAAGIYALFATPALLVLPPDRGTGIGVGSAVRLGLARTRATIVDLARHRELRRFLLAYLVYYDGVNTVVFFAALFADHTLGFTTVEVIRLFFVVQFSALLGA